jgi:Trypsin-like peptidase domain
MSLLDELEYPWVDPLAQDLHRTLIALQPSGPPALLLAKQAGVQTVFIKEQLPVALLWKEILDHAASANVLPALVRQVLGLLGRDHPDRRFLQQLLDGGRPPISAEPRALDATPTFLHADDSVSELEAMLFGDDLTIPIGHVPGLITALGKLLLIGPSVCKLTVGFGGAEQYGTAFRIGPELLLTNWHVLHRRQDGAPAVRVDAEFGFEDDPERGLLTPRVVRCQPDAVTADQEDDWAVVRTLDPLDDGWPAVPLTGLPVPVPQAPAFIVQHPRGQRKRVGFVRNQISYVDDQVVHYLTDTDVGSSGAPVLDGQGRLIALHHRGGRPRETPGKPPVRKNEGVRMSRVVRALATAGMADQGVQVG